MKNKRKLMWQQHLDLQFPLTQQLGLNLDVPQDQRPHYFTSCIGGDIVSGVAVFSDAFLAVNNSDGDEAARIDDTGISLRMEKQSWLKTKVANWIGVKYL
jgi:hypothetical protein